MKEKILKRTGVGGVVSDRSSSQQLSADVPIILQCVKIRSIQAAVTKRIGNSK